MKITTEGIAINRRFFHVIDVLRQKRQLRGLQTFTKVHDINYWNISTVKKEPDKHLVKPEWLAFLVSDYGVSAKFLLTGVGSIFEE